MSDTDSLRYAFRDAPEPSRRVLRAQRTRARALSPTRIAMQLLMVPVVTVALTVSIYVRASPYGSSDALRHLLAMGGCDMAVKMNVAPAYAGELGYHPRNDPDGDGVACSDAQVAFPVASAPQDAEAPRQSGAKFLRP